MPTPLSDSPLVVAHDEGGLPIARGIRHLMSNASTSAKQGVAHPIEALVDDEGITDPEEDEEEDSSDASRRSSIDGTTAGLGLDIAKLGDGAWTRVLPPPPNAPRARMLSLPGMDEEEEYMTYASFVPTPVAEGLSFNSDILVSKLANLENTNTDVYHQPAFFIDLEDDLEFSLEPEEIVRGENEGTIGCALLGLQT